MKIDYFHHYLEILLVSLEISFYQASQSQHNVRLSKLKFFFYFFHTALIVSFQCRYHICSICYRGTQEHVEGRSCWQRHSRQRQWQQARQQGRTRGGGVEFDSAFAKSTVAGFLRPLLKASFVPFSSIPSTTDWCRGSSEGTCCCVWLLGHTEVLSLPWISKCR